MRWSDPGDKATADEARCVASAAPTGSDWQRVAWRLVQDTGDPQLVASVMAAIFDEMGGQNTSIPTRRGFFTALWIPHRDAQIVSMGKYYGPAEIGRAMGLSPSRASAILRRSRHEE